MQKRTSCCCFGQRTGCYVIGAVNLVIGSLLFIYGVHSTCHHGWTSASFHIFSGLVYLFTSIQLLRGVYLQKGGYLKGWIIVTVLRLIGEGLYLILVHIVPYFDLSPNELPKSLEYKGRYEFEREYQYDSYKADYDRREDEIKTAKQDNAGRVVRQSVELEIILAYLFILAMTVYFVVSVLMYRRRLRTQKESARSVPAEQGRAAGLALSPKFDASEL